MYIALCYHPLARGWCHKAVLLGVWFKKKVVRGVWCLGWHPTGCGVRSSSSASSGSGDGSSSPPYVSHGLWDERQTLVKTLLPSLKI
jgi:hypothetical protein